ncbi:RNA 2',3'-cyclic phosphodiesterase OS=Ureibacillus acetophenoni OX=614649 GN=SAMN05877842_11588 PE=3 SV=1 [Ureibacillus acetophenoni]
MADKHHYFFAVKLPYEVKSYLDRWVQMHEPKFPFNRWVHPEDYHITLAFLGFAPKEMLEKAIIGVGEILSNQYTFELTLNELGTFGPEKSPRIFWADVKYSKDLNSVQKLVYDTASKVGFELDKKPFKPHITLARKWKSDEPFNRDKLTSLKNSRGEEFTFPVREIILYETHLDQTPKYKEFAKFTLKKAD